MIRLGTKKIIPFYEDYKPVEVRRNNVRIAGWLTETKSGEAVDFENTYNDKAEVLVHGNSIQDGEPSPENPVPVLSAGECNLLISDRTGVRQSIALPPLRKIGDVADTYNPATGEYVQRIGVKVFDGTEKWQADLAIARSLSNYIYIFLTGLLSYGVSLCTHLPYVPNGHTKNGINSINSSSVIILNILNVVTGVISGEEMSTYILKIKAYLAAQHAAGTPVTAYYQLAKPVVTYLDPVTVPTYPWYTRIEQDGAVKGTIEATCKVME